MSYFDYNQLHYPPRLAYATCGLLYSFVTIWVNVLLIKLKLKLKYRKVLKQVEINASCIIQSELYLCLV